MKMIHHKGVQQELIIFTRYPTPGKTKTRLIPALGPEGAARLQRTMTEKIVATTRKSAGSLEYKPLVYYSDGTQQLMQEWLGRDLDYIEQTGVDLGSKMYNAFLDSRKRGAEISVIVGSDCPDVDSEIIHCALAALQNKPLVVGPSIDGGYYLIGTTSSLSAKVLVNLFSNMDWGSSDLFQTTINLARQNDIGFSTLKELHDIDLPSDLKYLGHHSHP